MTSLLLNQATGETTGGDALGGIFLLFAFAVVGVLYFLPSGIALLRGHHQIGAILAINTFLGCMVVGWVVALAMALSAKRQPVVHQTIYQPPTGPWQS